MFHPPPAFSARKSSWLNIRQTTQFFRAPAGAGLYSGAWPLLAQVSDLYSPVTCFSASACKQKNSALQCRAFLWLAGGGLGCCLQGDFYD